MSDLIIVLTNGDRIRVRTDIEGDDGMYIATECLGVLEEKELEGFTYVNDIQNKTHLFRMKSIIDIIYLPLGHSLTDF